MVWTRLFKIKSIEEAMLPKLVNNYYRKPIIAGKSLAKVRKVFSYARLPFIYQKQYVNKINNPISPYHKFPKKFGMRETAVIAKMSKLKISLANSMEREIKVRQEQLNKRKLKGMDQILKELMPFFIKPQKVVKIQDDEKKKSRKKVAEYLKGVPKGNIGTSRKLHEKMKNYMIEGYVAAEDIEKNKGAPKSKNPNAQDEKKQK